MRWTQQEYEAYLARRSAPRAKLPPAEPKQNAPRPLVKKETRKAENPARVGCNIRIHTARLFDADNAWGSVKQLVDCLCKVGLLPGDSPSDIDLNVEQVEVTNRAYQKTVVEIW